ncbi:MAG: galactokinase [Candidatus Bipolaricaulia bacterium]
MSIPTTDLIARFEQRFSAFPDVHAQAPGRVNLIGEHTDYNDGLVLPIGIDRATHCLLSARADATIQLHADGYDETHHASLAALTPQGRWSDYALGVVHELQHAGYKLSGFEALVVSNVPIGAGLSSSAALEMSVACGLVALFDLDVPALELIRLSQRAENDFVGTRCGVMDPYVAYHAKADHAVYLDTRTLRHELIAINVAHTSLLVIDTGVQHELASGAYNKRREECEECVRRLQEHDPSIRALRDVTPESLDAQRGALPDPLDRRAQHVVDENRRVAQTVDALRAADRSRVGEFFYASHASLRDLYEVSAPELDHLVDLAQQADVVGARMTGGGFGGATIHLVHEDRMADYEAFVTERFTERFKQQPTIFEVRPGEGAQAEPLDGGVDSP